MTLACMHYEHHERHGSKYFFTSQIIFLMLIFRQSDWLVLANAGDAMLRDQIYSSVTPTLVMLRWRQHHIVNQD